MGLAFVRLERMAEQCLHRQSSDCDCLASQGLSTVLDLEGTAAPQYLLRDRDRIFGKDFVDQVKSMGIKQVLSAPRSPWQRAYVERVIGTIRRECLDHVIVFSERSPGVIRLRIIAGRIEYRQLQEVFT